MTLKKLIWDKNKTVFEKLCKIEIEKNDIRHQKLNPYYNFDKDVLLSTSAEKIHAINIIKYTKYWNRKYMINLDKKIDTIFFKTYIKEHTNINTYMAKLCGVLYDRKEGRVKARTMISWMNAFVKRGIMSRELYNNFVSELEMIAPLKTTERGCKNVIY